jgi:hypothetical protein
VKSLLGVGLLVLAACHPGAPRPLPLAADEVIKAPPDVVYQAALAAFTDQGLPLRSNDPEHGVLESEYFDVSQYRQEAIDYPPNERFARLRVLVGPDTSRMEGSRIGVQAIYSPFSDPTAVARRSERAIPKGHPAMEIVKSIMDAVKARTRGY